MDENTCRLDFTPEELVDLAERLEDLERRAAKERQGKRTDLEPSPKLRESPDPAHERRTAVRVAKAVGAGATTLDKARKSTPPGIRMGSGA